MRRFIHLPSRGARRIREETDAELQFHLHARAEALMAEGLPAAEARDRALREFGDLDDARRYINRIGRDADSRQRRRDYRTELRQDVGYALRKLRRAPGFTAVAVATLALGIGANTAIFSVVNSVLFRALPFPRPEQLYQAWSSNPEGGLTRAAVSAVDLDDWRAQRKVLADIGGYWYAAGGSGIDLTGFGEPQRLSAVFVTPGFFTTLGVLPAQGRLPRDDELVRGGRDRVVLLSHAFWQRQFGGDPRIVGTPVTLNGEPFEVLGVMPRAFRYPAAAVDVYAPFSNFTDDQIPRIRPVRILDVVARAGEGVTAEEVGTELNAITARLAAQYPEDASWGAATILPLHEAVTGDVRRGLLVLLGAVAFVLLIACVNVASLLLARATARGRELAVRAALGAGRGRLVRQLITESLVLALAGGVAGLALALFGVRALLALGAGELPRAAEVQVDATVLLFAMGSSLLTGLLFGLAPAVRAASGNVHDDLRAGGRGAVGGGGLRLRNGLVIAEVALAMVLVVGGGLMTRSFLGLTSVDPGFRTQNAVVLNFTLSTDRHPNYRLTYQQVIERVREVPGVIAAGSMKDAPLRGVGERIGFMLPGMTVPAGQDPPAVPVLHVSEGIFRALGARMLAGREFAITDRDSAPPVVVVNQAFARQWFPGEEALGKRVLLGAEVPAEVIGVVNDIRQRSMSLPAEPTLYVHNLQNSRVRMNLVVRARGDPLAMVGALREAVWSVDRDQPITEVFTLDDAVSEALARPRLLTVLLGAFGVLGLALGALGLYGVLAYLVGQRQREIGVRLALGAARGAVSRMIVRQGLVLAGTGVAIGVVASLALGRLLEGVLFGVSASDPATLLLVVAVLGGVAVLASWIPARRAAGVDPAVTLRVE
jgi:predicted permease